MITKYLYKHYNKQLYKNYRQSKKTSVYGFFENNVEYFALQLLK